MRSKSCLCSTNALDRVIRVLPENAKCKTVKEGSFLVRDWRHSFIDGVRRRDWFDANLSERLLLCERDWEREQVPQSTMDRWLQRIKKKVGPSVRQGNAGVSARGCLNWQWLLGGLSDQSGTDHISSGFVFSTKDAMRPIKTKAAGPEKRARG